MGEKLDPELYAEMAKAFRDLSRVNPRDVGVHFAANWVDTAKEIVEQLDDPETGRIVRIIKNWRAGNAGEDDVFDTARLIRAALATPTDTKPAGEGE